jgi:hypothetical protein
MDALGIPNHQISPYGSRYETYIYSMSYCPGSFCKKKKIKTGLKLLVETRNEQDQPDSFKPRVGNSSSACASQVVVVNGCCL